MEKNKSFYRGLGEVVGWVSAVLFVLGGISAFTGQEIVVSGNDYWQAAMYLVLFSIFAGLRAKE